MRQMGGARPQVAWIELDAANASYRTGEPIAGRMVVGTGAAEHYQWLGVELQHVAHGSTSSVNVAAEARFAPEPWAPGATYTYPFSFVAPPLPPPYAGRLFRTEVRVAAVIAQHQGVVEHARAFPAAARPILITAPEPLVVRARHPQQPVMVAAFCFGKDGQRSTTTGRETHVFLGSGRHVAITGCILAVGLLLMAGGVALALWLDLITAGILSGFLGLMAAIVGGTTLRIATHRWLAERGLGGMPVVSFEARETAGGSNLTITVELGPSARIDQLQVRFRAFERIVTAQDEQGGVNTKKHAIAAQAFDLQRMSAACWGITIPPEAFDAFPLPISISDNDIVWEMVVVVRPSGAPVWSLDTTLDAFRGKAPF